jgi:DNA repair protein RecN (Recombination protein N)
VIIDRLELAFQPGLNVLTGETGAGKSILLDSLGFVLGWRGRADLVRQGAAQGEVMAEFDLPPGHAALTVLAGGRDRGRGWPADPAPRNHPDGRKTAWVNDRRVSGEVLRALSETLVELHGQHDDRGLLNPRGHRQMLDAFAGLDLAKARAAWATLAHRPPGADQAEATLAAARKEEDFLRHAVRNWTS